MPEFSQSTVVIIDYGMGNLFSVKQACEHVGLQATITCDSKQVRNVDAVILPGVGAFGDAITRLNKLDLIKPILDFVRSGKPLMGVCLGMQLLMSESEEFGSYKGLNVFPGRVIKFPVESYHEEMTKVPQVGWNQLYKQRLSWDESPLAGISEGEYMYFVHSYYCKFENSEVVLSVTRYADIEYCSSILHKNIFACQFHPERSGKEGLKIYKNFANLLKKKGS